MKIVGFIGKAGSGKSTCASQLVRVLQGHGYSVAVLPFAAPLKRIAREMGWDGVKDDKGRRLLQLLGTECGRECIDVNIWVDLWVKAVNGLEGVVDVVIADDVRFENEAQAIHSLGGKVIRVTGNHSPEIGLTETAKIHASENLLPEAVADDTFDNDSTVEQAYQLLKSSLRNGDLSVLNPEIRSHHASRKGFGF